VSESAAGAASPEGTVGSDAVKAAKDNGKKPGLFARIALFVRQVIAELKKVVAPTRSQLINYSIVVTIFVLIVMALVMLIDFIVGKLVFWSFG
jgi:preprotein translocase subunit SecE